MSKLLGVGQSVDKQQQPQHSNSAGQYQPLGSGSLKDVHDSGSSPDGPQEEGHSSNRRIIGTCCLEVKGWVKQTAAYIGRQGKY